MDIAEIKKKRLAYLYRLWELSGGDTETAKDPWEVGGSIHMGMSESQKIVSYLMAEGLVEMNEKGSGLLITSKGAKEVKGSLNKLQKAVVNQQMPGVNEIEDTNLRDEPPAPAEERQKFTGELNIAEIEPYIVGLVILSAGAFSVLMGVSYFAMPPLIIGTVCGFIALVCFFRPEVYETAIEDFVGKFRGKKKGFAPNEE